MDLMVFVPIAIGVVAGLTQAAKVAGYPDKLSALLEVALGVAFMVAGVTSGAIMTSAAIATAALFWSVVYGVVVGLSAGGLYTYTRAAATAVSGDKPQGGV